MNTKKLPIIINSIQSVYEDKIEKYKIINTLQIDKKMTKQELIRGAMYSLTTEDGVELKKGDKYFELSSTYADNLYFYEEEVFNFHPLITTTGRNVRAFSTEKAVLDYISINKLKTLENPFIKFGIR